MNMRNPVMSLTWAMMSALEQDLLGVESPTATALLRGEGQAALTARPRVDQCGVVMFVQAWTAGELGFADRGATEHIEAETVVVTGPTGDACVYASTRLLYHVNAPNRRFFLDVASQRMRGRLEAGAYDGRDSADLEAIDYEVSAAFARLSAASVQCGPEAARRVARMLIGYVEQLEAVADLDAKLARNAESLAIQA